MPQNQAGYSLSVAPQNRREDEDGVGHASRSSGLFHMKASQARVSQFGLKNGVGAARMVYMTSSWRLHRGQVKDGQVDATDYVRPCYLCFVIFFVLGLRGILVFYLSL
jgi:hypothetical protein